MVAKGWFANSAAISLNGATVGALRNVKMTPQNEVTDIYGLGSILREKAVRHTFSVDVGVEFAMWDSSADDILEGFIAGSTSGDGSTADNNTVGLFTIIATIKSHDGSNTMTMTASSVYFSNISVEVRENEWISRNLTGKGKTLTIAYT